VTCDGLGVRARAWRLEFSAGTQIVNDTDGTTSIDSAAPLGLQNLSTTLGDTLSYDTNLNIQVYDAEITQEFKHGCWSVILGGGGRYAHIEQNYNHFELPLESPGDVTLIDAVLSGHRFDGFGPTASAEVRASIGNTGLTAYGSLRGSLLFGTGRQEAVQIVNSLPTINNETQRDDLIPITEFEIGGEFNRKVMGFDVFGQAALVGMVFYGAGNGANNELIPVLVDPEVSDNSSNFGLFGFKIAGGVRY
jgi:hypothetical protein